MSRTAVRVGSVLGPVEAWNQHGVSKMLQGTVTDIGHDGEAGGTYIRIEGEDLWYELPDNVPMKPWAPPWELQ